MIRTVRNKSLDDMIGVVSFLNGQWRISEWRPDGPSGHQSFTSEESLEREIGGWWVEDPTAGEELERWSDTPEWELGLKRVQFLQAWNACSFHNRYDLAKRLDEAPSLDEALALVPEINAELKKGVER